jgi:hypothetical protein
MHFARRTLSGDTNAETERNTGQAGKGCRPVHITVAHQSELRVDALREKRFREGFIELCHGAQDHLDERCSLAVCPLKEQLQRPPSRLGFRTSTFVLRPTFPHATTRRVGQHCTSRSIVAGEEGIEPSLTRFCRPPLYRSRKQGANLRLTGRMKPSLYQLTYSALDEIWLPLLDSNQAARDQSPVPYQLGEGGGHDHCQTSARKGCRYRRTSKHPESQHPSFARVRATGWSMSLRTTRWSKSARRLS